MQLIVNNDEMLGRTTDKTLHLALIKKDKEIERLSKEVTKYDEILCERNNEVDKLNNVINELEYWIRMNDSKDIEGNRVIYVEKLLKELKRLKEGK